MKDTESLAIAELIFMGCQTAQYILLPLLACIAVIGVVISFITGLFQIHETSVSLVAKLISFVFAVAWLGLGMLSRIGEFSDRCFSQMRALGALLVHLLCTVV